MSTRYLIDTFALYPLVIKLGENLFDYIERFTILDLTLYEVGNVLWKRREAAR